MTTATLSRKSAARAASVSRTLASNGLRPLPSGTSRNREGIRVSRSSVGVRVVIDLDSPREAALLTQEVTATLRGEGFHVLDVTSDGITALTVTHPRIAP